MCGVHSSKGPVLLLAAVAAGLGGCQMGPSAMRLGNAQYSDALRVALSEQLLVNLVRLRYRDAPVFLGVSNISTQFQFDYSGDMSGNLVENVGAGEANTPDSLGVSAGASFSERPTITYSILGGESFQRRMLTPIPVEAISMLAESGWRGDRVLRLTVEQLNELQNAPRASGPTPSEAPDYACFLEATNLMTQLSRERVIDFRYETRTEPISSPLPVGSVGGGDLVNAAKAGTEFMMTPDGERIGLTKRKRVLVMRFAAQRAASPEAIHLRGLLRLDPTQTRFEFVAAEDSGYDPLSPQVHMDELAIDTRSLMGVLYYLSTGVEVPARHEEAGLCTRTLNAQGEPFDWSELLEGLFRVHASKSRPKGAAVKVRHRGHWFYIRDDDETSKSTFLLLAQMFSLLTGEIESAKPVLTLPIGG